MRISTRNCFVWFICISIGLLVQSAFGQGFFYKSYQISTTHRYEIGYMGGFWGHHLGHMVRTASVVFGT